MNNKSNVTWIKSLLLQTLYYPTAHRSIPVLHNSTDEASKVAFFNKTVLKRNFTFIKNIRQNKLPDRPPTTICDPSRFCAIALMELPQLMDIVTGL